MARQFAVRYCNWRVQFLNNLILNSQIILEKVGVYFLVEPEI